MASSGSSGVNVELGKANELDPQKIDLGVEHISQVLSLLPGYEGKTIVVLYAGNSEFIDVFTKKANKVVAINVMETMKETIANKQDENAELTSTENLSPDISILANSVDLIFVNQLFMYLCHEEVDCLAGFIMKWLKPGAYIFFREPWLSLVGDHGLHGYSIHHHEPKIFIKVFSKCHMQDEYGKSYKLSHVSSQCADVDVRSRNNQICWLWKKVYAMINNKDSQQFLETSQYSRKIILLGERVYGSNTLCPGGIEMIKDFVSKLELKPRQKVLDVGCGIGGADFYMAKQFNVEVIGVDLSIDIISLALERATMHTFAVQLVLADCTKLTYAENTFDVIYSSAALLHVQDKPSLFESFYKWLKPGGKVLIADLCTRGGPLSSEFITYLKRFKYHLPEIQAYGQMLKSIGFDEVIVEDRTNQMYEYSKQELIRLEKDKDQFIKDFSKESYNDIIQLWKGRVTRCREGEQRWGLFMAKKKR